ncbi:MAG: hypothetical protein QNK04_14925 [Myxococcota bacterium]|nr:hypothetical protein [Myxococcota bacterium]
MRTGSEAWMAVLSGTPSVPALDGVGATLLVLLLVAAGILVLAPIDGE